MNANNLKKSACQKINISAAVCAGCVSVVDSLDMATALLEDAAAYAEQNKIFQLFESLLQELVVHKPDKPIDHLIKVLKRDSVPRVVVAGPPGAEAL